MDINDIDIREQQKMIQQDLNIDDSSPFHIELELKEFAKLREKYSRMYSKAVRDVDEATIMLEVTTAEIVDDLCKLYLAEKGKPYPPSGVQEIRKTGVPLVQRWKNVKYDLAEKTETKNILYGIVAALDSKGYRLAELFTVIRQRLYGDKSVVYTNQVQQTPTYTGTNLNKELEKAEKIIEFENNS